MKLAVKTKWRRCDIYDTKVPISEMKLPKRKRKGKKLFFLVEPALSIHNKLRTGRKNLLNLNCLAFKFISFAGNKQQV
jgi:hypothetical protein